MGWVQHSITTPTPLSPSQLTLWINEKMLTAQDVSYDEARNLHTKWQKHQAFAAELASNKGWLDKMGKVGTGGTPGTRPPPRRVPAEPGVPTRRASSWRRRSRSWGRW